MTEFHDPYGGCDQDCGHDLARGASVQDLRTSDGPYPDSHPLLNTGPLADRIAEAATRQSNRAQT